MIAGSMKTMLIVEDNPSDARLLREMLREDSENDVDLVFASDMAEAERHIANTVFSIILLDLGLPDAQGIAAIKRTHAAAPSVPLVVLSGMDDEDVAAQSLQEGAQDFLIKGQIESRSLVRALRYATERKRLEWLKDEFVSTVSHELRTPLTSIAASLGLLVGKSNGLLPKTIARLISIAHTNSQRLVRLVDDILDIEKLEGGRVEFVLKRVEVPTLVEQAIEANQGFAISHGVRIEFMADIRASGAVRADADRLTQAVTNLLTNAVKFSPALSEVFVTVEEEADLVRISVRDHGCGIPAAFKSHVFERFAQADATNARSKNGTGLGLSIVEQIVVRLGGKVGFVDEPEGGTRFFIELPSWGGTTDLAFAAQVTVDSEASLEGMIQTARRRMEVAMPERIVGNAA